MPTGSLPVTVDPDVSVYALVERLPRQATFVHQRRTMQLISYEIENGCLVDGARTRIFSAFQYMSKFLPQVKRYEQLAARAEAVYVFGVPDVNPPPIPGVRYIWLHPESQLAKEWFLVSCGRDYMSALATEEQTRITDPDDQRIFKGIWSFDFELVTILNDWLSNLVRAPSLTIDEQDRNLNQQVRLMSQSMSRLVARLPNERKRQNA
jgi:DICT domain-containing protein